LGYNETGECVHRQIYPYCTDISQQFQVNHRPGKRLLRSINLLQEELVILSQINDWQTRLVENYSRVLDDATYPLDIPSRRVLYPCERLLLNSCLDNLASTREDYAEQIRRCGPLLDSTKQSAEINEEDHGKAILVFTVVTVIFLPLSFVTSFLGMNTSDIRDMDSSQTLFWKIAIPLTAVVMGTMLVIAYNGDELRDSLSSLYRTLTGKQNRNVSNRGISVAQRKRAARQSFESSSTLDYLVDEAEYATPKPDNWNETYYSSLRSTQARESASPVLLPETRRVSPLRVVNKISRMPTQRMEEPHTMQTTNYALTEPMMDTDPLLYGDYEPDAYPPPPAPRSRRRTHQPGINPNVPTYMRIPRTLILPETLAYYKLPWEFDPLDTNRIVIKRHLNSTEIRMLMEHTRQWRENGVEQVGYGGDYTGRRSDGYGNNEGGRVERDEYTWVKKRGRGKGRGVERDWYEEDRTPRVYRRRE
jgi:hypothetical protein